MVASFDDHKSAMRLCLLSVSFATSVLAGGPIRIFLTSQGPLNNRNLLKHPTRLQDFSSLSSETQFFGSKGYIATIAYVQSELEKTGFYETQYRTVQHRLQRFSLNFTDSSGQSYKEDIVPIVETPL